MRSGNKIMVGRNAGGPSLVQQQLKKDLLLKQNSKDVSPIREIDEMTKQDDSIEITQPKIQLHPSTTSLQDAQQFVKRSNSMSFTQVKLPTISSEDHNEMIQESGISRRSSLNKSQRDQVDSLLKRQTLRVHGKTKDFNPKAFMFLSTENTLRWAMIWLSEWKFFEWFVILCILGNSLCLALYDYSDRDSLTERNQILDLIGFVFTIIFTLEALIKIIAMGFILHPQAYLRDGWNVIDFFVVTTGLLEILPNSSVNLKALRTLRVLRPLRSINAIPSMRKLVSALLMSIPNFANVSVFLIFIFVLFSILGLHNYEVISYNRCRLTETPVNATYWPMSDDPRVCSMDSLGVHQCALDQWCGNPLDFGISLKDENVEFNALINYDITTFKNIGQSLLTVFQIITMDGWTSIMYNMMDGSFYGLASFYFCILIVFGSFFLVNLILAVIMESFINIQQKEIQSRLKDQKDENVLKELNNTPQIKIQPLGERSVDVTLDPKQEESKNDIPTLNISTLEKKDTIKNAMMDEEDNNFNDEWDDKFDVTLKNTYKNSSANVKDFQTIDLSNSAKFEKSINSLKPSLHFLKTPDINSLSLKKSRKSSETSVSSDFKSKPLKEQMRAGMLRMLEKEQKKQLDQRQVYQLMRKLSIQGMSTEKGSVSTYNLLEREVNRKMTSMNTLRFQVKIEERSHQNKCFRFFFHLTNSSIFNGSITMFIILNTVVLALDRYPISTRETYLLEVLNLIFSLIFFVEMITKFLGIGIKCYFKDAFNSFDCFIVVISIIDISMTYSAISSSSSGAITALRAFRLLRVFKLAKSWKKFHDLLKTIGHTLKDISNFSVLLFLFIFTYTLLGMEVFAYKAKFTNGDPDIENGSFPNSNFNYFLEAFTSVFIVLANDGWTVIYFNYYRAVSGGISTFFFVTLLIFGQFILLNLFLAILLQTFDFDSQDEANQEKKIAIEKEINGAMEVKDGLLEQLYDNIRLLTCCCSKKAKNRIQTEQQIRVEKKLDKIKQWKSKKKAEIFLNKLANSKPKSKKEQFEQTKSTKSMNSFVMKEGQKFMVGNSLGCLKNTNSLRRFCYNLVNKQKFEYFILLVILISSLQLALESPLEDPNSLLIEILFYVDLGTTVIFLVEALIKIIAYGFIVNGEDSYLHNGWNVIDFGIVLMSLVSLVLSNFKILKVFRMMRVLRPLRVIARNQGLKIAIDALILAIPNIINVTIISLLFFLIFGIIAVNYFKGTYFYCIASKELPNGIDPSQYETKWDCINNGGIWALTQWHFNDVVAAIMTLFQMATTVGWADVMYTGISVRGIDQTHRSKQKPEWAFFFISFIIIGSFFILNLFVGIVISTFNREKERLGRSFLLTDQQKDWLDIKLMLFRARPHKRISVDNSSSFRQSLYQFQKSNKFENTILVSIILNTFLLMIEWYDMPSTVRIVTDILNYVFAGLFTLEAIIKIIALKKAYFKDGWNLFDFIIVIGTFAGIVVTEVIGLNVGSSTSIIRAFRIFRVFRLIKRAKALKLMFNTIVATLPAMANVGGLLALFLFMFSILGVNLMSEVKQNGALHENAGFHNFFIAFLTLLRISTGEAWHDILKAVARQPDLMFDCVQNPTYQDYVDNGYQPVGCGQPGLAFLFFISYLIMIKLIFLNLFIAIILMGYEETNQREAGLFNTDTTEMFKDHWVRYDPEGKGFIKIYDLPRLLFSLGNPLGWGEDYIGEKDKQENFIHSLNLPIYNDFQDYLFLNVLEALSMRLLIFQEIQEFRLKSIVTDPKILQEMDLEIEKKLKRKFAELHENTHNIEAVKKVVEVERRVTNKTFQQLTEFTSVEHRAALLILKNLRRLVKNRKKERKLELKKKRIAEQRRAYLEGEILEMEDIDLNDSSDFENLIEKTEKSKFTKKHDRSPNIMNKLTNSSNSGNNRLRKSVTDVNNLSFGLKMKPTQLNKQVPKNLHRNSVQIGLKQDIHKISKLNDTDDIKITEESFQEDNISQSADGRDMESESPSMSINNLEQQVDTIIEQYKTNQEEDILSQQVLDVKMAVFDEENYLRIASQSLESPQRLPTISSNIAKKNVGMREPEAEDQESRRSKKYMSPIKSDDKKYTRVERLARPTASAKAKQVEQSQSHQDNRMHVHLKSHYDQKMPDLDDLEREVMEILKDDDGAEEDYGSSRQLVDDHP